VILFFEKTWLFWWMVGIVVIIRWSRGACSVAHDAEILEEPKPVDLPACSGLPSKPSG
jgi:hypothetical protein